jgi:hypothetical protein
VAEIFTSVARRALFGALEAVAADIEGGVREVEKRVTKFRSRARDQSRKRNDDIEAEVVDFKSARRG